MSAITLTGWRMFKELLNRLEYPPAAELVINTLLTKVVKSQMKTINKVIAVCTILNMIGITLIVIDTQWFRIAKPAWRFGELFYLTGLSVMGILPAILVCKLASTDRRKYSAILLFALGSGMIWGSVLFILSVVNPDGLLQYLGITGRSN